MKRMRPLLFGIAALLASAQAFASGPLGICAIIERVVVEPNTQEPATIQLHGAFAFYDGNVAAPSGYSSPQRGYMTFKLPNQRNAGAVRREWADLAAVAGTGQAVAFGGYGYIGSFDGIAVDQPGNTARDGVELGYTLGFGLGVRPVTPEPSDAVDYVPGSLGVVLLGEGNYDSIVAALRAALEP